MLGRVEYCEHVCLPSWVGGCPLQLALAEVMGSGVPGTVEADMWRGMVEAGMWRVTTLLRAASRSANEAQELSLMWGAIEPAEEPGGKSPLMEGGREDIMQQSNGYGSNLIGAEVLSYHFSCAFRRQVIGMSPVCTCLVVASVCCRLTVFNSIEHCIFWCICRCNALLVWLP